MEKVRATVNSELRYASVKSGYVELGTLEPGDAGSVTFDIPCKEEVETVDGVEYKTLWVGSQIIEILPRGEVSPLPF